MSNNSDKKSTTKVLYQNLGGKVYAFTEVDGEIFFGKVSLKQTTKEKGVKTKKSKKEKENENNG